MGLWSGLAVLALVAAPVCSRADTITIASDPGVRCTVHRNGELLGMLEVPPATDGRAGRELSNQLGIDSTVSHADILITCTRGDIAVAKTLRYRRIEGEQMFPICVAPAKDCGPPGGPTVTWGYTSEIGVVRMAFDR